MKYLMPCFVLIVISNHLWAQGEQVFTVRKPPKAKDDYQRLFDLNVTPGQDTLETWSFFTADFSHIYTYYDSIAAYNAEITVDPNHKAFIKITTARWGGHSILKFYKKQKDSSYNLVYIKNWVVIGKKD